MMLDRQYRGLWTVSCDKETCVAIFELNGNWDIMPSKQNTIYVARKRGWSIGKETHLCPLHNKKGQQRLEKFTRNKAARAVGPAATGSHKELKRTGATI